ncbi:hypothetical protein ElyMa_006110100 [Elysia marginata]|uniref:Uncharacterized protein n=1 Tax=Elysia marginata TaxID=1093978 RepID=A0AAV4GWX6_9GAST|nr:hypothetical protein ElyMa_006110100 [Elysia marginata]
MNPGSTTAIQNVKYNRWSIGTKLLQVQGSSRKVLFTVFWDMEGVVHKEFLEHGQTVNSERCIQHFELSNPDSDVFGVMKTQSCNTKMQACLPVAKLNTP